MIEPVVYNIEIVDHEDMFYDTLESYTIPFVEGQIIEFTLNSGDKFDRERRFDTLLINKITHYIERTEVGSDIKCKYNVTVKVQKINP